MTTDTSTQLDGAAVADKDWRSLVWGACMLATPAYDPIADAARIIEPGDWYMPAHETVWTAITRLHGQSQPTGLPMVVAELTKSGDLARIGGRIALSQMVDACVDTPARF
ncbi:DnaB-like helicase N-terminal domain-containing protein [Streptomyces shaanxiensis]